jgi:hypothetical protein
MSGTTALTPKATGPRRASSASTYKIPACPLMRYALRFVHEAVPPH